MVPAPGAPPQASAGLHTVPTAGRSGRVWETGVTEEDGLKEETRSEGRADRKWERLQGGPERTRRGSRAVRRAKGEQEGRGPALPRPGPSGPCVLLAPLVRWRALGGEVFSERLAPSSKPTQRTAHTHTDAWAPRLPQGRGVDQRPETQTPSDSACEKLPGDFRSALPHSLAPGSYLETWKVLLRF